MPDWLVHIGIAYILAKLLRIESIFPVLIGAVLPDSIWFGMWSLELIGFSTRSAYSFVLPFHTPFMMLIISIFLASFLIDEKKGVILIYFGAFTHLILDAMEYGNFVTFLYPFDIHPTSFNIFTLNSSFGYLLQTTSFLVLVYAIIKPSKTDLELTFRKYSVLLIPLLFLIPLSTYGYVSNEFFYFKFADHPEDYDDQEVFLANRPIISTTPLAIDVTGKNVYVETDDNFKIGDHLTVNGVYNKERNIILNTKTHLHNDFLKPIFSVMGGVLMGLIFFKDQNLIHEGVCYY